MSFHSFLFWDSTCLSYVFQSTKKSAFWKKGSDKDPVQQITPEVPQGGVPALDKKTLEIWTKVGTNQLHPRSLTFEPEKMMVGRLFIFSHRVSVKFQGAIPVELGEGMTWVLGHQKVGDFTPAKPLQPIFFFRPYIFGPKTSSRTDRRPC